MRTFHREGGGRRENVNLRYNDVHYTVNSCPRMEMYEAALKPHFVTRVPKIDNLAIRWPFPSVFHVSVKIRPSSITNVYRANKYSVTSRVSYIMCCYLLSLPSRFSSSPPIEILHAHDISDNLIRRFVKMLINIRSLRFKSGFKFRAVSY